ncbi:hypothetical protein LTR08_003859 [Meristemomyces frigidus]|nr:hypothetical protein LTR08_003859 [Meristemomyces frigidus]
MDYAKKKNDELSTLCKERGLAHTGKKADLVKRLEEYDAAHTKSTSTENAATGEDEIDWDDEPTVATEAAKAATSQPAADALAAGGVGPVKNPVAVLNQVQVEDPAETVGSTVVPPAEPAPTTTPDAPTATAPTAGPADTAKPAPASTADTPAPEKEKSPEKDFNSAGLEDRTVAEELEKRKARALRFGLPVESEEIKLLERAKRFGAVEGSKLPGLLNQALSAGTKRGRSETVGAESNGGGGVGDAGVKKRRGGGVRDSSRGGRGGRETARPATGRRQGSERPAGDRPTGEKRKEGGYAGWMNDADRQKAEARKARFAPPT